MHKLNWILSQAWSPKLLRALSVAHVYALKGYVGDGKNKAQGQVLPDQSHYAKETSHDSSYVVYSQFKQD